MHLAFSIYNMQDQPQISSWRSLCFSSWWEISELHYEIRCLIIHHHCCLSGASNFINFSFNPFPKSGIRNLAPIFPNSTPKKDVYEQHLFIDWKSVEFRWREALRVKWCESQIRVKSWCLLKKGRITKMPFVANLDSAK